MKKEVYDYIAKKVDDRVIEEKICKISGEKFYIFQSEKDFLEKIIPRFPLNSTPGLKGNPGVKIFPLPFPTLSPQERQRRRMLHKNGFLIVFLGWIVKIVMNVLIVMI